MRKAGLLALSLGLAWSGMCHAQDSQSSSNSAKGDQPRSLIEAVGFRKKCCGPCDSAPAPVASCPAGNVAGASPEGMCPTGPASQYPMAGGNGYGPGYGHGYGNGPAPANNGVYRFFGHGLHLSGQYPSWAWRHKPEPPPPPPELYPGISWHRYPRSPRDFWMIEP